MSHILPTGIAPKGKNVTKARVQACSSATPVPVTPTPPPPPPPRQSLPDWEIVQEDFDDGDQDFPNGDQDAPDGKVEVTNMSQSGSHAPPSPSPGFPPPASPAKRKSPSSSSTPKPSSKRQCSCGDSTDSVWSPPPSSKITGGQAIALLGEKVEQFGNTLAAAITARSDGLEATPKQKMAAVARAQHLKASWLGCFKMACLINILNEKEKADTYSVLTDVENRITWVAVVLGLNEDRLVVALADLEDF